TLPRVPPPRLQSQVTAHVPAFTETMWVFERQQERQRDQRPYALDLLQQLHLRIILLGEFFDVLVVLDDLFADRFDSCQSRLQCSLQLRAQSLGFFWFHVAHVAS